ncbi:MAG: Ig-like domain-containing protein [Sulfurimonas sp.]
MGKAITIIVKEGQNVTSSNSVTAGSGKPLVIKAKSGQSYELKNITKGVAPDEIYVVRDGKNLKIKIGNKARNSHKSDKKTNDAEDAADIIIEEYFEHDCSLIGVAENGQYYNYIPQGADPAASYYSLGGETLVSETETDWLPIILGTLGAGAIAAAAGGGGGGETPPPEPYTPSDTMPPESLTVTVYADNQELNTVIISTEKGTISVGSDSDIPLTNDNTPVIKGRTEAGATVTARDEAGNMLGTATADNDGNYTIAPTTPLSEGQHYISATATDAAGNAISANTAIFEVDTVAPDAPLLDPTDGSQISGTAEAESTVTLTDDNGNPIGTTTADGNGNFTYTPDTPLTHGTEIAATATDTAGNVSEEGYGEVNSAIPDTPTVYDDIAPVIGEIENNGITDDTLPTITGSGAGDNLPINIYDNGVLLGTTTSDDNGSWRFNPSMPFADGSQHSITYTVNEGPESPAVQFTVDTAAPDAITMVITDNVAPITGTIDNNAITDDTTPTISGTTEPGATVTIKDGDTLLGTVTADENGGYTLTPTTELYEGVHSVTATATDAAGNSIDSTTTHFTIDTTAPAATTSITAITNDTGAEGDFITSDTTLVIDGTNTELGENERVQLSLDDGTTWIDVSQSDTTHWSYNNEANALTSGEHTLQTRVVDAAGNAGEVSGQTIIIDTAAPTSLSVNLDDDETPVTGPITAGTTTDDTTPVISGQTEAGATVTAKDDDGNVLGTTTADSHGNYTITPTTELSEGLHYIQVTAADTAGNDTTVSSVIFTVDTTAPDAPLLDPTDGSQVVGTAEPGSTVTITDGSGHEIGTTTANQNGNFSYAPTDLIPDATVINATAMDPAGNKSLPGTTTVDATITEAPVVMDDVAPVQGQVLNGDTTNDALPEISGSAGSVPANVAVTIYDNGTKIGETTSNADGSWSFTPSTPFNDGSSHSITYTKNGSTTNYSPVVNFTVDTTAPTITMALNDDVAPITGDITDGSTTNDTKPTISGVTEADATVIIKDGATVLGTTTADSNGNYTFIPIAPLNEGTHAISAIATDAAGNSVTSTTTGFTVDSIAPTVEMTITDDVGIDQGPVSNGATIDDTKPTISGNTEAGATVTIKDGDIVLGVVTSDSNGDYTFTPDESLSMDEHTITATATDTAGNTTTSTSTTFTIAPPAVIDLGEDGQLIHPVFVDGNYYYYWDRDGDGEGKIEGASDMEDWFTHDELDDIFMYDENGQMRPDDLPDTDDTYRYAELGGYELALPTYGGDMTNDGPQHGTAIDNTPPGEINPIYDDLVAIWDAFNGGEATTTAVPGVPEGWSEGLYWSATQYNVEKHYAMDLTNGLGATNGEHDNYWVAVQVVF